MLKNILPMGCTVKNIWRLWLCGAFSLLKLQLPRPKGHSLPTAGERQHSLILALSTNISLFSDQTPILGERSRMSGVRVYCSFMENEGFLSQDGK